MLTKRTFVLSLIACASMAGRAASGRHASSWHGTLIEFARRNGRIAVAADSREVSDADDHAREVCKLRLPKPTTLLAIQGRATFEDYHGKEVWNGLDSANEIFSSEGVESEQSIEQKENLWLKSLQDVIAKYGAARTPDDWDGKYWAVLNVFTLISPKVRIRRAALLEMNGRLVPYFPPDDTPADAQAQEGRFGLTAALNASNMNEQERERYQNLINVQEPKASTVEELRTLVLSLERLGSDVNGRMAAAQHETAEIAGPFSSATLDESQQRWLTYPEGPCAGILPPPPVHR
jgi:hypothetical protein